MSSPSAGISERVGSGSASNIGAAPYSLEDRWNIGVGVTQKVGSLAAASGGSEHRLPLIVATVQQNGQKHAVIDIAGVQHRRPRRHPEPHRGMETPASGTRIDVAIGVAPVYRLEPIGAVERVLLMSLWRSATAEIAAE
ncbi:hypothetical protein [Bradyrhizobium cosmicum]|uniref:hypothetical protein n=1 Tax=Bradyrhizobium cosmicum TaxID=1404864 RepID=UPI0028E7E85A|nr:hypothetical protein [Bradyrhizobium cosmicum]